MNNNNNNNNNNNLTISQLITILIILIFVGTIFHYVYMIQHEQTSILFENLKLFLTNSYFMIFTIILSIVTYIFLLNYFKKLKKSKRTIENAKSLTNIDGYYRDIPCNYNLERAFWLLYHCDNFDEENLKSGILGAFILKWIKEKNVFILDDTSNINTFRDDNYKINLGDGNFTKTKIEEELYNIFKEVASENNILEKKEFINWQKKNNPKLDIWFNNLINSETRNLENNGLLKYKFPPLKMKKILDPQLVNELKELLMLKNFLLDFSLIYEKEHIEVALWEYYLIFATLFGIADKVDEQFNKLIPNYSIMSKIILSLSFENLTVKLLGGYFTIIFSYFFLFAVYMIIIMGIILLIVLYSIFEYILTFF